MSTDIPGYYLATKKDHRPSVVEYVDDGKVPAHWLNVSDSRLSSCPRTYGYDLALIGDCVPAVAAPVQVVDNARVVLVRALGFLELFRDYAASEEHESMYEQSSYICREVVAFLGGDK